MIRYKDTILENYFIDPITAVITNDKGEIQKTYINKGRPIFKKMYIHVIQMHTHLGYKKGFVIHHLDHDKLNNSLSNLVYLTSSAHSKIHAKGENNPMFGTTGGMYGKHHSEETKKKMRESHKGNTCRLGTKHSGEAKRKISKATKGEKNPMFGKKYKWINNGIVNKFIPLDEDIPEGFVCGRLKRKK